MPVYLCPLHGEQKTDFWSWLGGAQSNHLVRFNCGDGDGRYPVEVVMGATLWRWWWEVPRGGGDGRYLVEVVMEGTLWRW